MKKTKTGKKMIGTTGKKNNTIFFNTFTGINMSWDGEQVITSCPYIQEAEDIIIVIPLDILRLLDRLDKMFPDTEYSFYMKHARKDNYIILHGIYVPEQIVSYAEVEVKEKVPLEYNVHIHKHPKNVDKFSVEDLEYSCANNEVSLLHVHGKKGFSDIRIKKKLPCGYTALIKVPTNNIVYYIDYEIDIEKILKEFREKVEKHVEKTVVKTIPYTTYYRRLHEIPDLDEDLEDDEKDEDISLDDWEKEYAYVWGYRW